MLPIDEKVEVPLDPYIVDVLISEFMKIGANYFIPHERAHGFKNLGKAAARAVRLKSLALHSDATRYKLENQDHGDPGNEAHQQVIRDGKLVNTINDVQRRYVLARNLHLKQRSVHVMWDHVRSGVLCGCE